MRMPARMSYSPALFALSVLIAIVAATAALWAALRLHGVPSTLGASLIMGVAVSGMHYTGMAAMHVFRAPGSSEMSMGGATALGFLLPLAAGIAIVTFILIATIGMSPTADEIREEAAMLERSRACGLHV
jgi:NO-binding membrane sensor protein with MHYT domain